MCSNGDPPQRLPSLFMVEYLQTSMSSQLLTKFPDNTAFDFDYSQSSIWSPYRFQPISASLSFRHELGLLQNTKRAASQMKKRLAAAILKLKRKRRSYPKSIGFDSLSPLHTTKKVMRTAVKCFKKKSVKEVFNSTFLDKKMRYSELS